MHTVRHFQSLGWIPVTVFFAACGASRGQAPSRPPEAPAPAETTEAAPEPAVPPRFEATDQIAITTSLGTMTIELYGEAAPKTVANFLGYVESGFFANTIFHRVIDGFMIQGGGFDASLERKEPNDPIDLEIVPGLKHEAGILSMARQPNSIHSATSQFFICTTEAPQLNGTYAAFGRVVSGEEVLFAISRVATHSVDSEYGKMNDVPIKPVLIESVKRL